jgi:hypothetical protein
VHPCPAPVGRGLRHLDGLVNAPLAGVADEIGKQLGGGFDSILRALVG